MLTAADTTTNSTLHAVADDAEHVRICGGIDSPERAEKGVWPGPGLMIFEHEGSGSHCPLVLSSSALVSPLSPILYAQHPSTFSALSTALTDDDQQKPCFFTSDSPSNFHHPSPDDDGLLRCFKPSSTQTTIASADRQLCRCHVHSTSRGKEEEEGVCQTHAQ